MIVQVRMNGDFWETYYYLIICILRHLAYLIHLGHLVSHFVSDHSHHFSYNPISFDSHHGMLFSGGGEAYLPEERERAEYMLRWFSGRKLSGKKIVGMVEL